MLLHVPLAPYVDVSGVARLFRRQPAASVVAPVTEIPVDWVDVAAPPRAFTQPPGGSQAWPASDSPAPTDREAASTTDAEALPAPAPAKKRRRARQRRPAPAPTATSPRAASSPTRHAASESIADPTAAIRDLKLPPAESSLRLLVHVERLRGHALAAPVAALLRGIGPWRGLFQDGALDPTRDIDRLLLVAPDLSDSHAFVSVFDYNVPRFRVRQAVTSDRGRFCGFPARDTLVIGPPSARGSVENIARNFSLPGPSSGELLSLHVDNPAQTLHGLPWAVPSSLRWARVEVKLTPDGGARLALLARDASPAAAARSAHSLTGALGTSVVAEADSVLAALQLTPEALLSLLSSVAATLGATPVLAGADDGRPGDAQQAEPQQQAGQR